MDKNLLSDAQRPVLRARQFCPARFPVREALDGRTWCVELVVGDEVVESRYHNRWFDREDAVDLAHIWGAELRASGVDVEDEVAVEPWTPEACAPYAACREGEHCIAHSDPATDAEDRAERDRAARAWRLPGSTVEDYVDAGRRFAEDRGRSLPVFVSAGAGDVPPEVGLPAPLDVAALRAAGKLPDFFGPSDSVTFGGGLDPDIATKVAAATDEQRAGRVLPAVTFEAQLAGVVLPGSPVKEIVEPPAPDADADDWVQWAAERGFVFPKEQVAHTALPDLDELPAATFARWAESVGVKVTSIFDGTTRPATVRDLAAALSPDPGVYADAPLVWLDLETTGLAPGCRVLELALVVTDADLDPFAEPLVLRARLYPDEYGLLEDGARAMHEASGLLRVCRGEDPDDQPETVEAELADFAVEYLLRLGVEPGRAPLAGASPHFDRRVLADRMPRLHDFLFRRNVDVSTLRELCARWRPDVAATAPEPRRLHRALPDVEDALALARHYRDSLFRPRSVAVHLSDATVERIRIETIRVVEDKLRERDAAREIEVLSPALVRDLSRAQLLRRLLDAAGIDTDCDAQAAERALLGWIERSRQYGVRLARERDQAHRELAQAFDRAQSLALVVGALSDALRVRAPDVDVEATVRAFLVGGAVFHDVGDGPTRVVSVTVERDPRVPGADGPMPASGYPALGDVVLSAGYTEDAPRRAAREAFEALEQVASDAGAVVFLADDLTVGLLREDEQDDATLAELRPSPGGWPVEVTLVAPGPSGQRMFRRAERAEDLPLAEFATLLRSILGPDVVGVGAIPDGARVLARLLVEAWDWATNRRVRLRRAEPDASETGRVAVETAPSVRGEWRLAAHLAWGEDPDVLVVKPADGGAYRLDGTQNVDVATSLGDALGAADEARATGGATC